MHVLLQGKRLPESLGGGEEVHQEAEVSDEDEAADIEDEAVKADIQKKKKASKLKLAKELSDCVVMCQSVSFKGFDYALNNCKSSSIRVCSLTMPSITVSLQV